MDERLDLFNAIKLYDKNRTENDALLVLAYNKKEGDLMLAMSGDVDILSAVMENDNEWLELVKCEEKKVTHYDMQLAFLNITINILRTNDDLYKKFKKELKSLQ